MSSRAMILAFAASLMSTSDAMATKRLLFSFYDSSSARKWQTVNDGVMGGRSDGRFRINRFRNLEFLGNLSLANNGGFASVRSRASSLNLKAGDSIVLKVRGDGREYSLNLYTPARRTAFSYRAKFQTKSDEWITFSVPLEKFVATSFGRQVSNSPLNPRDVNRLGVLLGDKQPGPFKLEIESISVTEAD